MADNGLNMSDLLISKGTQLIIPSFSREKQQFSKKQFSFPITMMKDLLEYILKI